jgi:transcriptional regulator with XRE-family HTH domain
LKLKKYLETHEVTAAHIARRVGVSRSYLGRLVRDLHTPRLDVAQKIVEATGGAVTFADLLPSVGETDSMGPNPSEG